MSDERWCRVCVVGIGGHARTKLIPAIAANGQELAGLVSGRSQSELPDAPVFARVEEALAALPPDTLFLLASPPALHATQAEAVLAYGRDVLIEKPAFVTAAEAQAAIAHANDLVLAEGFMQRHTTLYRRWLDYWAEHRDQATALDITFVVPSLPAATFRAGGEQAASSLYDIGCYVVALLDDMGLDHAGLVITHVAEPGALTERVTLAGTLDGVKVSATVGVAPDYNNSVSLYLGNGDSLSAAPFFYGRPGERRIDMQRGGERHVEMLGEPDAFQAMLARQRAAWLADQPARLARLVLTTATLERLGFELAALRAGRTLH